jgi:hypothetical protein
MKNFEEGLFNPDADVELKKAELRKKIAELEPAANATVEAGKFSGDDAADAYLAGEELKKLKDELSELEGAAA